MEKFEFISLTRAKTMTEQKLQIEIGKRAKYLKEEFGMDANDTANFISSLLNIGVAMNERLKDRKTKKESE